MPKKKKTSTIFMRMKLPTRVFRSRILDFSLGFGGVMIAVGCAYLPWYIHNHSNDFSPPRMVFTGAPGEAGDLEDSELIDPITTASVPKTLTKRIKLGSRPGRAISSTEEELQPMPKDMRTKIPIGGTDALSDGKIVVLFATAGRALIQDDGDLVMVEPGMVLSDGSVIGKVVKNGDGWIVQTRAMKNLSWSQ